MFDDFRIDLLATEGTKWTRRITGVVGGLLGGGIGYLYHAIEASTGLVAAGHVLVPALVGAGLGWLFSGWVMLGLLIIAAVAIAIGWQWFTGSG